MAPPRTVPSTLNPSFPGCMTAKMQANLKKYMKMLVGMNVEGHTFTVIDVCRDPDSTYGSLLCFDKSPTLTTKNKRPLEPSNFEYQEL